MSKKKKQRVKHSTRDKRACLIVKHFLIEQYGTRCWLCSKDLGKAITLHHIVPRYAGGLDNLTNGSLLCEDCQKTIHFYDYGSEMYSYYTNIILGRKKQGF